MNDHKTESVLQRLARGVSTFLRQGLPEFRAGDRVNVVDEDMQTILGDDTGTVEKVDCTFYRWEYRVVADNPDPDAWLPNVQPEGEFLTADQIEPISAQETEQ